MNSFEWMFNVSFSTSLLYMTIYEYEHYPNQLGDAALLSMASRKKTLFRSACPEPRTERCLGGRGRMRLHNNGLTLTTMLLVDQTTQPPPHIQTWAKWAGFIFIRQVCMDLSRFPRIWDIWAWQDFYARVRIDFWNTAVFVVQVKGFFQGQVRRPCHQSGEGRGRIDR